MRNNFKHVYFIISGLIAARELGLAYPDLKPRILVVSSTYYASRKVFGDKDKTRAFPLRPLPGQMSILYNTAKTSSKVNSLNFL